MAMSRRKFMAIAGGGIILGATGAAGGFVSTRTPRTALEPWTLAGSAYTEPRRRAFSYAVLAPNPHNRQPWIVDLDVENEATLYVDTNRLLPETDPFSRQITVGLGCFLELLEQAACEDGYRLDTELFPDGSDPKALDDRAVARIQFAKAEDVKTEPLFAHVLNRRSLKESYDTTRPVSNETLAALEAFVPEGVGVGSSNEAGRVEELRELTRVAWQVEYETPPKLQESIDVMRFGRDAIDANPDGIDMGGAFLETLMLVGAMSPEALADPNSVAYAEGYKMYDAMCMTSQAFVWLTTAGNTRLDQIAAGRAWCRVNLAATEQGLGVQPMSQALQEFPEMAEHYDHAHALLAGDGETVQMLGRLGYAAPVPPSPRWPIDAKIRNA